MTNYQKGHQGFTSKYKTLGKTENIRIPTLIKEEIETIVNKIELINSHKGKDCTNDVLENIIKGMDKYISSHIINPS